MKLFKYILPLWQGVSDKVENCILLDFELYIDEYGLIRQRQSESVSQKIANAYADEAYRYITLPAGHSEWANQQLAPKLNFIVKSLPNLTSSTVLEIGAGSTYLGEKLVKDFQLSSYVVVDPSVRETSDNLTVVRDYFSYEKVQELTVDYVLSLSCLEHVPDPITFLKDINKLLLPRRGEAIILFPEVSRQFNAGDINVLLHEHLTYFTKAGVLELLPQLGFEILAMEIEQDLFKLHLKAVRSPLDVIKVAAEYELVNKFSDSLSLSLGKVREHLDKCLRSHQLVGFHGACNGLNNLLASLDIQDFSHIKILDLDTKKTGKFISACPNPICLADKESYQDVDVVFVSAMTFYQPICKFLTEQIGVESHKILPLCSLR